MALCPAIVNSSVPQSIVTIDNIDDVRVSTTARALGTTVDLTCHTGRTLVGPSQLTCVTVNGQTKWDNTIPTCGVNVSGTDTSGLSQQELIVIGVVAAICILVLIMVVVMLCACWYRRRRDRTHEKRPGSEYSSNTIEYNRPQLYSMYTPFPMNRSIDRQSYRPQYQTTMPAAPSIPESFPRTNHPTAYELATRSAAVRPKSYVSYAGPRIAKASSDTYEDYLASRNNSSYRPYVVGTDRRESYDNEGFRGEWTDRYDKKKFNEFNRDAFAQGRDPFLWESKSTGF